MKMGKKEICTRLFVLATMLVPFVDMAYATALDEKQSAGAVYRSAVPELSDEQKVGLVDLKNRMGYYPIDGYGGIDDEGRVIDFVFPILYRDRYYEDGHIEVDTVYVIDPAGAVPMLNNCGASGFVANPMNYMGGENQIREQEYSYYLNQEYWNVWDSKQKLTLNGDALFKYSFSSLEPEITFRTPMDDLYWGFDYSDYDGIMHLDDTFYSGETRYTSAVGHMAYEFEMSIYRFFDYRHDHRMVGTVVKTPESGLLFYHELFKLRSKEFSGLQRLPSTEEYILIYTFSFSMESECAGFIYDTSDEVTIYVTKPTTEKSIQNAKKTFEQNGLTYDYW